MPASFPGAIKTFRAKEDKAGVVYDAAKKTVNFAKDETDQEAEIVAIETALGVNPVLVQANIEKLNIDGLAILNIDLYTVPDGYEFYPIEIAARIQDISELVSNVQFSIYDRIKEAALVVGYQPACLQTDDFGYVTLYPINGAVMPVIGPGSILEYRVDAAAVATTYVFDIYIAGFLRAVPV